MCAVSPPLEELVGVVVVGEEVKEPGSAYAALLSGR